MRKWLSILRKSTKIRTKSEKNWLGKNKIKWKSRENKKMTNLQAISKSKLPTAERPLMKKETKAIFLTPEREQKMPMQLEWENQLRQSSPETNRSFS